MTVIDLSPTSPNSPGVVLTPKPTLTPTPTVSQSPTPSSNSLTPVQQLPQDGVLMEPNAMSSNLVGLVQLLQEYESIAMTVEHELLQHILNDLRLL